MGAAALLTATAMLVGCSASNSDEAGSDKIAGEITVLTNRTNIVDTLMQDYVKAFEQKYPDVKVKIEGISNYEDDVTTRMNTKDYGDVLLIPNSVTKDKLSLFFEPLGDLADMKNTYRFVATQSYDGKTYGLPTGGNANGVVYNKRVWEKAGITEWPTSPEEFLADLKKIKATGAIPLYTNYKDGWPLAAYNGNQGTPTGDAKALETYVQSDAPWTPGEDYYIIDSLLFDAVNQKLTEDDPLTTNWEDSKVALGKGQIGTMVLGSWAIVQMQEAAEAAGNSADDIGFMPFPTQAGGKFYSTIGGDYNNAISVHSKHKAAARAWIDFFANESGFAEGQGMLSPLADAPSPSTLAEFDTKGVQYLELEQLPAEQATWFTDISNTAEIDVWGSIYRQKLVDIARGAAKGTKDGYFDELNKKWADARAEIVK